jgi:GT2 family glycosyltransferase
MACGPIPFNRLRIQEQVSKLEKTRNRRMDLAYSPIVATLDRPGPLRLMLQSLAQQTRLPSQVVLVDASENNETEELSRTLSLPFPIVYLRSSFRSSARQRNEGATRVSTPLIAFMDDDIVLEADTMARLLAVFEGSEARQVGGIAGRIRGSNHPQPKRLLWWYYRLQAGYADQTFGARLFGPAINTFPCFDVQTGLVPADWLSSTCVVYWTDLFLRERFPDFDGYSFMEDVHLSARIAKTHRLYFDAEAVYDHFSQPTDFKSSHGTFAAAAIRNRQIVARDVMGQHGLGLFWRFFFQRLFETAVLVKHRKDGWLEALRGTWR